MHGLLACQDVKISCGMYGCTICYELTVNVKHPGAMCGENCRLVVDEPVEFEK